MSLFVPSDIALSEEVFGANCGPRSFAAFVRKDVCRIMRYFKQFPDSPWTTMGHMEKALTEYGLQCTRLNRVMPEAGLALIEFHGAWSNHWAARLKRTHWIAYRQGHVFEPDAGIWFAENEWRCRLMVDVVRKMTSCGGWSVMTGLDVVAQATCDAGAGAQSSANRDNLPCTGTGSSRKSRSTYVV